MPKAKAREELNLRVQVSGWSYDRHVIVRENEVAMEIARTHCSNCPTCSGRISHCENALRNTKFKRQSAGGGEYFILPLPSTQSKDPTSIAKFLGDALKLNMSAVR
jgi:hypothetical protein